MVANIKLDNINKAKTFELNGNLEEIRDSLSKLDFNSPGLHILNVQPGIGKTHLIKNLLKQKNSFLLVTGTHKLIDSEYDNLSAKHWKKFKKKCKIYDQVKKLHSSKVSIGMICRLNGCKKRECAYWRQFNTQKAVGPFHYLPTERVNYKTGKNKGKFKFKTLVLDESMQKSNKISLNLEEIENSLNVISKYIEIEDIKNKFLGNHSKSEMFDYIYEKQFYLYKLRNNALKRAIYLNFEDDVEKICLLDIYGLKKYYYYHSIHKDIENYSEPYFYHIFDLARQGIPIIILDASFDKNAFAIQLEKYRYEDSKIPRSKILNKELKSIDDININFHMTELSDTSRKIRRMDKNNYYYKKGLLNNNKVTENGSKTIDILRFFIDCLKRKYSNIGIITYKDMKHYFADLGETDYFFNLRGSNKLENTDALFIIGTPQNPPKDTVQNYNTLCITNIDPNSCYKRIYQRKDGEIELFDPKTNKRLKMLNGFTEKTPDPLRFEGYDDLQNEEKFFEQLEKKEIDFDVYYPLTEFDKQSFESEIYQTIHRGRPFINQKEIYVFGHIPKQIKSEFEVKTYDKKSTELYFRSSQFKGIYPLVLYNSIINLYQKNQCKSEDIAKALKIYKKDKKGYNTSFVTKIINGTISIQNIVRIDNELKINPKTTPKKIKRKFRALEDEEEFIDYCIYYIQHGSFIENNM